MSQPFREVVHWLAALPVPARPETDGELLRAYVAAHDEAAFAELLRRHGSLVWRVCARSSSRIQDAEDAFQATFFILARQAASVRKGESLASWLFGVARRATSLIRKRARRAEPATVPLPVADAAEQVASTEECDAIFEEVRALPEKYRLPLLLCGLEGLTKKAAAQQLGWKEGTVSGRLARARALLQRRLTRRGVVSAAVSSAVAGGSVPSVLQAATLREALRFAQGELVSATPVSTLASEVMRSMRATSSMSMALVLGACLLTAAAGAFVYHQHTGGATWLTATGTGDTDGPAWKERLVLRGYAGGAYGEFSPDGKLLATVDGQSMLRFLDTTTWQERSQCPLTKYRNGTRFLQWHPFSADSRFFAMTWRLPTENKPGERRTETWLIETATGKVRAMIPGSEPHFSPTANLLVFCKEDSAIVYDPAALKELRTLPVGGPVAWRGDWFSPDGKRLFLPTTDGRGKLWDAEAGKALATLEGYNPVWSKDNSTLATVLPGPLVKVWDGVTGRERLTLRRFTQPGCGVQLSPDGRYLLSNGVEFGLRPDGEVDFPENGAGAPARRARVEVRLWDARTGKELVRLPGETRFCRPGVLAPDGKTIAYVRLVDGEDDKMEAVLWDVAGGKERLVLKDDAGIDDLSFSPDGATLLGAVGNADATRLQLWDTRTGRVLNQLEVRRAVRGFSPDGKVMTLSVPLPVPGPLAKPVASPMELRVFEWSAGPVTRETRGAALPLEPVDHNP